MFQMLIKQLAQVLFTFTQPAFCYRQFDFAKSLFIVWPNRFYFLSCALALSCLLRVIDSLVEKSNIIHGKCYQKLINDCWFQVERLRMKALLEDFRLKRSSFAMLRLCTWNYPSSLQQAFCARYYFQFDTSNINARKLKTHISLLALKIRKRRNKSKSLVGYVCWILDLTF